MPYNLDLEKRLDRFSVPPGDFTKKVMFGGVGYMLKGDMAFGIHQQALLIRTSAEQAEQLLKQEYVSVFALTGRPMKGWLLVAPGGIKTDTQLSDYLRLAVDYASTLPPK